jgi:carboxylesterase type B
MKTTFISLLAFVSLANAQRPTVTLNDGVYVGTTIAVPSATVAVDAFYGIPYAAANPERFGAPLPRPKGSETHDAIKQPPVCIQQQCKSHPPQS